MMNNTLHKGQVMIHQKIVLVLLSMMSSTAYATTSLEPAFLATLMGTYTVSTLMTATQNNNDSIPKGSLLQAGVGLTAGIWCGVGMSGKSEENSSHISFEKKMVKGLIAATMLCSLLINFSSKEPSSVPSAFFTGFFLSICHERFVHQAEQEDEHATHKKTKPVTHH